MSISENEMVDRRKHINYPLTETGFHRFLVSSLKTAFNLVLTLEINGQNNIPLQGAVILAANHVTNLDIFPLQIAVNRPIFFMGKSELFKNPLLHYAFRNLGAFPVNRGERDEWAISHSKKILQEGQVLGMFPEGTRSRGRGLRVAKTGAARLALELGCPIIPVGIDGSHTFFKQFPRRNLVKINIGEQLCPEPGELPIGLTDRVMFELARNLPVELRGVYA